MLGCRVPSPAVYGAAGWLDEGAGASTAVASSGAQAAVVASCPPGHSEGAGGPDAERQGRAVYSVVESRVPLRTVRRAGWMRPPRRPAAGLAALQLDVPEWPPRRLAAELATRGVEAIARPNDTYGGGEGERAAYGPPPRRWCNEILKSVRAFRPSQIYAGNLYLENHLISSLKEYFKQNKTLEYSYLGSSRLLRSYIRPNRGTRPTCTFNFKLKKTHRTPPRRSLFHQPPHRSAAEITGGVETIVRPSDPKRGVGKSTPYMGRRRVVPPLSWRLCRLTFGGDHRMVPAAEVATRETRVGPLLVDDL
jgi:hypothetical protein